MYLTPHEIRQTREDSLHFLLTLSAIPLSAGERFAGLLLSRGRQTLGVAGELREAGPNGEHRYPPPAVSFQNIGGTCAAMLEEASEIAGDAQRCLMQAMESQVRGLDRLFIAAIDRGARTSPWEGEIALNAMRAALQSAEAAFHGMTDTAIQAIAIAEGQARQAAESLLAGQPKRNANAEGVAVVQE